MNLAQHLPALQVVVPLLAAPLTVLLRNRTLAFAVVLAASWIAFAISVLLWMQVDRSGTISYAIGSWPPPWGIEYRVDRLSAFMLVLVSGWLRWSCRIAARASRAKYRPQQHYLFYTMFALCLSGLLGISDHRRRFQRLRVPGDLVAVDLRADRLGTRPARTVRFVSVPDHGHHRRHVLRHRRRVALPDDRHVESRRHGAAPGSRRRALGQCWQRWRS